MSENGSVGKVMSGCVIERWLQTEAQNAVGAMEAQESIGLSMDAILLRWERIAARHKALGMDPISFRGKRGNIEKVSPGDELGRV